jgi:hypothetical protein
MGGSHLAGLNALNLVMIGFARCESFHSMRDHSQSWLLRSEDSLLPLSD